MSDELDGVLSGVGPRLRALRVSNGLTLAELAEATDISVSTLSRLESGLRKPSLELLLPLARVHRVPLDELVGAPETGDPRVHARPFHRGGQTIIPLTRRPGGIQAFKNVIAAGVRTEPDADGLRTHEGYEWLYVLNGRVRLKLGAQDFVLKPGEVAEFDTHIPHWFGSADGQPVEFLSLFGPQGERIHVRASDRRDR